MGYKMFNLSIILIVLNSCGAITISTNGNSPMGKMPTVDIKDIEIGGFVPIIPYKIQRQDKKYVPDKIEDVTHIHIKMDKPKTPQEYSSNYLNNTKLPVNERYRRLIPYMTFYLANDFNSPHKEEFTVKPQLQNIVIPTGEAVNGKQLLQYNNIPKYQGNRLTNFNIASAFPSKIIKDYYPQKATNTKYYNPSDVYTSNNNVQNIRPALKHVYQNVYDFQNPIPVPVKINYGKPTEAPRLQIFSKPEKPQRYKLVPYEQTPPVPLSADLNDENEFVPKVNPYYKKPVIISLTSNKNNNYYDQQFYQTPTKNNYLGEEKHREKQIYYYTPLQETHYDDPNNLEYTSEPTYKYKKPYDLTPITESGFKPIINTATPTPATKFVYITSPSYIKQTLNDQEFNTVTTVKPRVHYKISTTKAPFVYSDSSEEYADLSQNYGPSGENYDQNNLAQILKTLQDSHSLPQKITADNVDTSIKTLVQIINNLKTKQQKDAEVAARPIVEISSTYKPPTNSISPKRRPNHTSRRKVKPTLKPAVIHDYPPQDLENEHPGIQDIVNDENDSLDDERGGTPGKPGVDYPTLATIPTTGFDCKSQRYKGFFGDPETKCQVWHYCDLNGGQASFLCPNGTIFSQVALTCDWWFNVKCDTTPQLYVLNERLYKYILPYTPKFPEDYSGPLVDKYLSIKYKEMEEDRKNKEKEDTDLKEKPAEDDDDEEEKLLNAATPSTNVEMEKIEVIEIKTSGMSGALRPYDNKKK